MKNYRKYNNTNRSLVASGESLVADYVSAITNLTTAETAKYVADKSEQDTISTIASASQGQFVMPQYIPPADQESLVRSSLDAHIKKVQAEQLTSFTWNQIVQMETDDKQKYVGRKVQVTILDPVNKPVESYWYNSGTGQYTSGYIKSGSVKGIIEDISIAKNMIILRPTLASRVILPNRKYYAVYVVNPQTLQPLVRIAIL